MPNFKPDLINGNALVSDSEKLKNNLWSALESIIPNNEHESRKKLDLVKEKYHFVSYEDMLKELGSVGEEMKKYHVNNIKGLDYTKDTSPDKCVFMKADREDGASAYAVVGVNTPIQYRGDFFSPSFYSGHGSNHDYNCSELLGSLYDAITRSPYPEKI